VGLCLCVIDNMTSFIKKIVKYLINPKLVIARLSRKQYKWEKKSAAKKLRRKKYKSYSDYLKHQESKLVEIIDGWLPEYDIRYRVELRERLKKQKIVKPRMSVLCLAARVGTEVKSFLDLGCFAVGLDINPGEKNKYVVYGDFHDIQYVSNSADIIFTNSLDHTFDINQLIKEIKRVLKPKGFLILEIFKGVGSDYYAATSWGRIDDVLNIFIKSGFQVVKETDFEYPWQGGRHIALTLKENTNEKA